MPIAFEGTIVTIVSVRHNQSCKTLLHTMSVKFCHAISNRATNRATNRNSSVTDVTRYSRNDDGIEMAPHGTPLWSIARSDRIHVQ